MKKILVILALLFSSSFANHIVTCRELAYNLFIQMGSFQFSNTVYEVSNGKIYSQQDYDNMFSIAGTNEIVKFFTNSLRQKRYYNTAELAEFIFNKEQNKIMYLIKNTFNKEYYSLMELYKNGTLKNDKDLEDFMYLYRNIKDEEINQLVKEIEDGCKLN